MNGLNIAVLGAGGRMGRELLRAIADAGDCRLSGASARPGSSLVGRDAGEGAGLPKAGIVVCDSAARAVAGADAAVDFSLPAALAGNLGACREAGCPLVIGVTGFSGSAREELDSAAAVIPIVLAANLSLGANLLRQLAAIAAGALPASYDAAILDVHHRHKRDAPSGTALVLREAIAAARPRPAAPRPEDEALDEFGAAGNAGIASLRAGEIVGEHTVLFAGPGETIELRHRVQDRASFAAGALRAARWIVGRPPAVYGMEDVAAVQSRR